MNLGFDIERISKDNESHPEERLFVDGWRTRFIQDPTASGIGYKEKRPRSGQKGTNKVRATDLYPDQNAYGSDTAGD
jgi:hypothetical protein